MHDKRCRLFNYHLAGFGVALLAGALASCKLGPNYQRPALDVPGAYRGAAATQTAGTQAASEPATQASHPLGRDWWLAFGDDDLTRLEQAAIAHNPNLKVAMEQVIEARATARGVKGDFYPQITFSPTVLETVHTQGKPSASASIPFDLSYEVDLWGKIARSLEAADANTRASADQFGVALLTLEADVAQAYFKLRSLERQAEILHQNVVLAEQQLDLTRRQLAVGIIGRINLVQEQTQIDSLIPQETDIFRQRDDEEHALAILTGVPPSEFSLAKRSGPTEPPVIPPGLPAELLRRRPDVAAAEENLIAANANIGVAITQFYPAVSLVGTAGYENVNLLHLGNWEDAILAFGPSVSLPIFTGGKLDAQLQLNQAKYRELVETYKSTLLTAFNDVETSLTDVHMYATSLEAQHKAVEDSREYLRLAQDEYRQGLQSQLNVLDAQRTLLTNEDTEAQLLNNRMVSTVLLIKAIGGGWDSQTPLKTPPATNPPPEPQPSTTPATEPQTAPATMPARAP